MKKLVFGLMRMPLLDKTNAADVDIEQVKRNLRLRQSSTLPKYEKFDCFNWLLEKEKDMPKKVLTICPQQINIFEVMRDFTFEAGL